LYFVAPHKDNVSKTQSVGKKYYLLNIFQVGENTPARTSVHPKYNFQAQKSTGGRTCADSIHISGRRNRLFDLFGKKHKKTQVCSLTCAYQFGYKGFYAINARIP